jgi:site-specific DNA recombinase
MDAIALIRVSTQLQASEGVSLAAQERKIRIYCETNGLKLLRVFEEAGVSGCSKLENRGTLNAALDEVCRRKCALVIYSLSRLSRSMKDTLAISERLHRAGAEIVSLTEKIDSSSAAGKMVFSMMALLQNFEVEQLRERIGVSMSYLRKQNRRISGHIPFGYDLSPDGSYLSQNDAERKAIETIKTMRTDGHSLWKIATSLDKSGIATKRGAKWSATAVRAILMRELKIAA